MKFDIEEYKNNPERRLILRNKTNEGPRYWDIEETQVSLGDIVIIKVPYTNLDFPIHTALDQNYNLRHEIHGIIGTLEFANKKLTMEQFIDQLINLPIDCSFDFSCHDGKDGVAFGVTKLKRFDTILILLSKYGGGCSGSYDVDDHVDIRDMESYLECYLEDYLEEHIYIDTANADVELWGVSFEHTNVDGLTFRRLVTSYPVYPFFVTKQEAEQWIAQHPGNNFDQEFDPEVCSNPSAVLIDRWSIRETDGKCIRSI